MTTLLVLKFTVTPILVAVMSLVARRFGPAMGGIILGLPWMTGPILFFLALERGDAYLEETARGVLMAVPAIAVYTLAYTRTARRQGWPGSLLAGTIAFVASGLAISTLTASASTIALMAVAALLATRFAIAQPRLPTGPLTLPWWDIPARMVATGALVGCITVASNYLGPTLLGIVSSFPVIMTVLTTFSHHRWGVDAAVTLLRSVMLSLIGFVAFFEVLALVGQSHGLVASFVMATVAGLAINALMLAYGRWSVRTR